MSLSSRSPSRSWKGEPLRLIVGRTPFSATEIAKLGGSRRLRTIHPDQLQLALYGKTGPAPRSSSG